MEYKNYYVIILGKYFINFEIWNGLSAYNIALVSASSDFHRQLLVPLF